MQFGAHMSSAGGIDTAIDRIEAIGGDCVQVFTQSPRMWRPTAHKPEAIERFKARRAEAGIGGVVCHALYLCNLAAPDDEIYEQVGRDALRDGRHGGRDRGRRASSSTSARTSAPDSTAALEAGRLGAQAGPRALRRRHVAADGELRRAGRHDRPLDRRARALVDALDRHPRLGICLDSCHLYASGYDVTDPAASTTLVARGRRRRSASTACARCTSTTARRRSARTATGTRTSSRARSGEGLGVFLAHPAFQELGAYLEVPGAGDGPGRERAAEAARAPRPLDGVSADAARV